MDHHCGIVLLQVVRGRQAQLVLSKTTKCTHTPLSDTCMKHSVNWYTQTSSVHAWQVPGAVYLSTDSYEITRNKLLMHYIEYSTECVLNQLISIFNAPYVNVFVIK
jgi:hypothetical protein